jgi:ABC-type enterochelin transport system permease subunit
MAGRSTPLAIAFWTVGACWAVAVVAYLCGVSTALVIPLTVLGIFTGIIEFVIRRKQR